MSTSSGPSWNRTYKQENTTVLPNRCVKHGTGADEVVAAVDGDSLILGIAASDSNGGVADYPVAVTVLGFAKLVIAAATTKGAALTATTGGKGAANTTDNKFCVGWLDETTTVSDQIARVVVNPFIYATV